MTRRTSPIFVAAGLVTALALTGCGQAGQGNTTGEDGRTQLTMWTHSAGNAAELAVYEKIITDFNASQDEYEVVHESFPQGAYNDAIVAAAASGDLPCLLDLDGPIMPNWAWAEYLQPLEISTEITDKLLPTAVGVWDGEIYSAGYWDAALSIFARKSVLDANGIRIPSTDQPWTASEFDAALSTLQDAGYDTPIDIGAEDTGEWWPYAYSPLLQSFGGDLIDRDTMLTADGALNGDAAVEWGTWFQNLFAEGYASNAGTIGNQEFVDDEVALSYTGVWNALASVEAIGDDLLILPPPDFGNGPKIGGGSWQWAISSGCNDADGARQYLEFSFNDEYITEFADNQIVIPATEAAAQASEYFGDDGVLRPFVELSQKYAVLRPETPAYAVISTTFETAAKNIMSGADVTATLDQAVADIDANIASNDGYGFQ
ncbi:extracellular solute-binding protein [Microbacterium aurugineum]|uniref:Extracellular solute-binding protein n=1 Tax=Microbacterium aurugineum TaxID=2851642 RepID=A0ABY4J369_9MICO|nr:MULTISPECIES: extracellular solute-binding protein [Microbacterium]PKQ33913.1 MAG: sugar-binding protein [Actinobacteria bacterium HGW-Actinobacteria-11]MCE0508785.1 extracellular solute-binding protein [Microbacterium sp. KKR3/1]MCK8466958.1 extracellular solute-binding protein [Microbacterium aurugineum]MCZ4299847.1 extracellular solute-binding protein [Microbacterium oxydans]QEA28658.1 extracellular solute-binding protein [Microbacterium sp. CBA3102]